MAYAFLVIKATGRTDLQDLDILRLGARAGAVCGVFEAVTISVETFTGLSGAASLAVTASLLLLPFVGWGLVAARVARRSHSLRLGVIASIWTAMITSMVGVTFGLFVSLAAPNQVASILVRDPDFLRSGWTNVRAFVLANTFDNAFTHLLGALIVGTLVGWIGGLVGAGYGSRRPTEVPATDWPG